MDHSSKLQSALIDFLAEVDTIKPESIECFDHAPSCEWIVQVDPATQLPVYKNVTSGLTEKNMPDDYRRYLCEFDQFMQHKSSVPHPDPAHSSPKELHEPVESIAHSCLHKKRKHSLLDNANNPEANTLYGLLSYSDSSGTENEIHDGLNARQRRRLKRAHQRQANVRPSGCDNRPSEISDFIGPLFLSSTQDSSPASIAPERESNQAQPGQSSTGTDACDVKADLLQLEAADEIVSQPDDQAVKQSVRLLFDQFNSLHASLSNIAHLHILLVQLSTRLEDWQSGALSRDYFLKKLQHTEDQLACAVGNDLPVNWTGSWDRVKKKFVYTNHVNGQVQDQPPTIDGDSISKDTHGDVNCMKASKHLTVGCTDRIVTLPHRVPELSRTSPVKTACGTTAHLGESIEACPAVHSEGHQVPSTTDRAAHLKAQLREFEEVCRAFEELDASVPQNLDKTVHISSTVVSGKVQSVEQDRVPECQSKEKRSKKVSSSPHTTSKTFPNLIRKWQQLQESL